jgi:retron-type reverse transcriptase
MNQPTFEEIISLENLLLAWKEFIVGKKSRKDVLEFQQHLMKNIIALHEDLKNKTYVHGGYHAFKISDPKPRDIHKASVRDRLLHHAIYRILYSYFDRRFISDSYSCRLNKGTHKALERFKKFSYKVSKNRTKTTWILKCDVRKFFASIDQKILLEILTEYISDKNVVWLLSKIIGSFNSTQKDIGLPLGNLTSQLLVNIYTNELDQFIKHRVKARYYIRYADDFVIFSNNKNELKSFLFRINNFLLNKLKLQLHPDKVFVKTIASGVDFLGWVNFQNHKVLRTVTKKRMFRNIKIKGGKEETLQSYLGLLSHGNSKKLMEKINTKNNSATLQTL